MYVLAVYILTCYSIPQMNNTYTQIPNDEVIEKTAKALQENNITTHIVENKEEAKKLALSLIPEQAEVMTMTSVTLDETGIAEVLNDSDNYNSVKTTLSKMDRKTQSDEMQKLGAAPDYAIGSVHAVTEEGHVIIASNTGSQLPSYAYGSNHVVWVVGAQKIVKNTDEGLKRIYEHVLPLESERAHKAYGVPGSNVSKLLIINNEVNPQRLTMIIVKENLGF